MITNEELKKFIESNDSELTDEELWSKLNKFILKIRTEAYDNGYKSGANQKDNKPCVCGFWGPDKS
jgi:hypothetical protein